MKPSFYSLIFLACLTTTAVGQHDVQRNAVQNIADGKYEVALKTLKGTKKPSSGEAETRFVKMLSFLHQNQAEKALKEARKAVDAGLPFVRLVAGPPEQMAKLHALEEFQAWKSEQNPSPLVAGPMLGNATDKSIDIWLRTDGPQQITIKLMDPKAGQIPLEFSGKTDQSTQFSTVISLDGMLPNHHYQATVEIDGETVGERVNFKTFPEPGASSKFTVAFGGGAGYIPEWERMWDTILEEKPSAMLMLGDNVYIDKPESAMANYYCYMRRQARPEWQRFTANTPIYSIWDDHDFGVNDVVAGPAIDEPKWKRPVWNIFRENWANPSYGGGEEQPGCWYDFRIADVHFIMLDGRFYRDLDGGTMLGPVQKAWLLETLGNSDATFKLLVSPVPFSPGVKPGSKDTWDGFPEEREEIFSLIESKEIEGVFLVAADRHRTDLRTTPRENSYDLWEFMSSRLTNRHTHEVVKTGGLKWGYNEECSFGLMHFDTTGDDPQVTLEGKNIDGKTVGETVLKLSQLR